VDHGPFQDALLTEELDPGLFRKSGSVPEKKEARIDQFVELLRRAIGSEKAQVTGEKHERDERRMNVKEISCQL